MFGARRGSVGLLLFLIGCGAVRSTSGIVRAQAELTAAKTAKAPEHAPFETAAAEAYLHKAREEQSYADLVRAVAFAEKAWSCARVARLLAEARMSDDEDAVRPEHFAAEAVCRPGPDRGVPLAHLEEAALGGARPSGSARAAESAEPTDPVIAPPGSAPEPVREPPSVRAPPPSPAPPPPEGDAPPRDAVRAPETPVIPEDETDDELPEGDPLPEGDLPPETFSDDDAADEGPE